LSKLIGDIKVNILLRYTTVIYNFAVGVVLARLLSPEDFGLVAIVYVFYNILATIGDMGLGASIVQFNELLRKDIITLFAFTIIIGFVISIILYSSSYLITYLYKIEELKHIIQIFSLSLFFYIINNVPASYNRKNKRFKYIGIIEFVSFFISGFIAIVIAYLLKSYNALVLQLLIYNVLLLLGNLLLLYSNISSFIFSELLDVNFKVSISKVYKFSRNSALFDITNYFNRNIDNFVIGSFFGTSTLGFYDRAYKLFLFPIHNITKLLNPILHPIFVEYKNEEDVVFGFFLKLTRFLGLIGFPLSILLYFSATDFIQFLYGDNWLFAGEILKILSLGIGFQMISTSGSIFFYTSNNSKLNLLGAVISLAINLIVISVGLYTNSFDIILYGLVLSFIITFIYVVTTISVFIYKKSIVMFLSSIKNIVIISLLMIASFVFLSQYYLDNLLLKISLATISFLVGFILTGEYKWVIKNIKIIKNGN